MVAVTSTIITAFAELQIKQHADNQSLYLMIKNQFASKQPTSSASEQFSSAGKQLTLSPNSDTSKKLDERWNQFNPSYFDLYLDEAAQGKNEIVILGKDIYYRNMVLFI